LGGWGFCRLAAPSWVCSCIIYLHCIYNRAFCMYTCTGSHCACCIRRLATDLLKPNVSWFALLRIILHGKCLHAGWAVCTVEDYIVWQVSACWLGGLHCWGLYCMASVCMLAGRFALLRIILHGECLHAGWAVCFAGTDKNPPTHHLQTVCWFPFPVC
jgi:hypothetical protein